MYPSSIAMFLVVLGWFRPKRTWAALFWLLIAGGGLLLALSAGFSSVTDNIPLAAMLAKVLGGLGTDPEKASHGQARHEFGALLGTDDKHAIRLVLV